MNKKTFWIFIADLLIVTACFFFFIWIKPASRLILPKYSERFLLFLILWTISSFINGKYRYDNKDRLRDFIYPVMMNAGIVLGVVTVIIYSLQQYSLSRLVVFGTIGTTFLAELFMFSIFYYYRKLNRDADKFESITEFIRQASGMLHTEDHVELPESSAKQRYPAFSLSNYKEQVIAAAGEDFWKAVEAHCTNLENSRSIVVSTTTSFNIEILPANVFNMVVNLRQINDIQRVNKFFEAVNAKIPAGGIFIGTVVTNEIRKAGILRSHLPVLNYIYYFFHYIFNRLFPKLPVLKNFYFFVTNGFDRSLSRAETFGRLYSCGFEVLDYGHANDKLFFISRKVTMPVFDLNPTYGPLISLKRIGKNGKVIHVYKLRTMHPYAEYLQSYIHEQNSLDEGGKFRDDFRISSAGRIFRKLWLDELPMLINLLRGDLKLVGVRPLSQHYFSLYTTELQQKRIRYKPGLIPPYYADMPKTLEEIMASENRYLDAYEIKPFLTDWKYFWKAFTNIVFRRARSK